METRLKERLVGAIVLVAIVVIVVPELLTGPRSGAPDSTPDSAGAAPVRTVIIDLDSGQRSTTTTPDRAGAAAPATPAPVVDAAGSSRAPSASGARAGDAVESDAARAASDPAARPNVTAPASTASAPAPAPASTPTPAPTPAPAPTPTPTPPRTSTPNPNSPPKSATTPAPAPAAEAPPPSRAAAPPSTQDAAPPRPKPSGATSGWVVQLGSFASRPNAEKLAGELRGSGYAAFVSEFRGSGRVLYRVRVGPEQDRGRADALAARLAREGRKGTVAPHP
jgi:DedD protein